MKPARIVSLVIGSLLALFHLDQGSAEPSPAITESSTS